MTFQQKKEEENQYVFKKKGKSIYVFSKKKRKNSYMSLPKKRKRKTGICISKIKNKKRKINIYNFLKG